MKVYSSKSPKGKLDKLVGDYYRSKPCEYCTSIRYIQWAHIKSRRYLATRWEKDNSLSLCAKCHRHFTNHPDLFIHWIDSKWPARSVRLNALLISNLHTWHKKDFEELYEQKRKELNG